MEDAHAVANSLQWGPDGWLYGAQGSTVTAQDPRHRVPAGHLALSPASRSSSSCSPRAAATPGVWTSTPTARSSPAPTGAASPCCIRSRAATTSRASASTAPCTIRTPTATSTTCRTSVSRAATSPAAASSTRAGPIPTSTANVYIAGNLLSSVLHWHILEPQGIELRQPSRRRIPRRQRYVVPADRLPDRAGRRRLRRRLVRQARQPRRSRRQLGPHQRPHLQDRGERSPATRPNSGSRGRLNLGKMSSKELVGLLDHPNDWYRPRGAAYPG